jgi:hypothetical protein
MQRLFNSLVYSLILPTGVISQTSIAKEVQQSYFGYKNLLGLFQMLLKELKDIQIYLEKKLYLQ